MRLHRLEIKAFGSFGGSESVDFDRLSDAGIFLLHGPTGAGKTTILDAVSFALFGKVPGVRSSGGALRSDHALGSSPTEVRLEVTIRTHRYRIMRRPRQQLPKRRGVGMRDHAPRATVEELVGGEWVARAAKPTDADLLLQEQLQMAAEQFHQIVMLPQGDFARFLRATPEERRAVLEHVFATERFTDVERWLRARADAADEAVRDATEQLRRALVVAATISGSEPYADDASVAGAVEWLRELERGARAESRRAATAAGVARADHEAAKQAHTDASELHGRQRRHAAASRERSGLVEAEAEHRHRVDALAVARRAAPVLPLLELVDHTTDTARDGEEQLIAARAALVAVAAPLAEATVSDLTARVDELSGDLRVVSELTTEADALELHAAELAELDTAIAAAESGRAERMLRREQLPALGHRLRADLRTARDGALQVAGLEETLTRLRARHGAAVERDSLAAELQTRAECRRAATDRAQAAYAAWLALLDTQLRTRSAALAAKLAAGEPCPVCGSADHPHPATAGHELITDSAVDDARAEHESAKRIEAAELSAVGSVEARLAAAHATAADADAEHLAQELGPAETALARAQEAAGRVGLLEQELAVFDDSAAPLDAEIESLGEAIATSREHRSRLDATVVELRRRVRAALAGSGTLDARREALYAERNAITVVLDAHLGLESTRREARTARERAEAAAAERGFPDLVATRHAAVSDAALVALESAVKDHEKALAEIEGDLARPELIAAAALPPVDLAAAARAAAIAEQAWSDASTRATNAEQTAQDLGARLSGTVAALDSLGPLAIASERARRLADLASGEDRQVEYRMRLSTYVLAARLEQVAAVASERLRRMSNDRYTIVHTDEEGDGRRKGGLGLKVVDAWTSTERDTNSLSGGEGFFTSLALALGVADVVAAEAGGLQMETLFVDEGFGTLDDETLHDVLDVLDGLRAGGRAVGIVSHVTDLRSRVTAQLEVVKGNQGSTITFAGA